MFWCNLQRKPLFVAGYSRRQSNLKDAVLTCTGQLSTGIEACGGVPNRLRNRRNLLVW